jgi:SAM-dependent methyltransferase
VSDAHFRTLARDAAAAYPRRERFARHFAYGKLSGDPAFAHLLRAGRIPAQARLLDIGCGQGLLCALLAAAHARHARGEWDAAWPAPPALARYTGIDLMARNVERARAMAGHWTSGPQPARNFVVGDMRDTEFPHSDVVVILDVLHYIGYEAQEAVLERARAALLPRGTLLLRVGDESPSMSFRYTLLIDRLFMAARGHRLPRLWCRPVAAWREQLQRMGFEVETVPMSAGTLFANVLLVARYDGPR